MQWNIRCSQHMQLSILYEIHTMNLLFWCMDQSTSINGNDCRSWERRDIISGLAFTQSHWWLRCGQTRKYCNYRKSDPFLWFSFDFLQIVLWFDFWREETGNELYVSWNLWIVNKASQKALLLINIAAIFGNIWVIFGKAENSNTNNTT